MGSPSPNLNVHLKGAVAPVNVAVNVSLWFRPRVVVETAKPVTLRVGTEKVYVLGCPG